jgi:hypothetical protein
MSTTAETAAAATGADATSKAAEPPTTAGGAAAGGLTGYEDEETLHKLADVLRTTMKIRNGVLQETRVDYFKGAWRRGVCCGWGGVLWVCGWVGGGPVRVASPHTQACLLIHTLSLFLPHLSQPG